MENEQNKEVSKETIPIEKVDGMKQEVTDEVIEKLSEELKKEEISRLEKIKEEIEAKTKEELLKIIKDTQEDFKKQIKEYEEKIQQLNQPIQEQERKGVIREKEEILAVENSTKESYIDNKTAWEELEKAVLSGKFK